MSDLMTDEADVFDMTPSVGKGNDRRLQTIRETLDAIIAAVDVDNDELNEYDVVGATLVRAGLMWRCIDPACKCVNHLNYSVCDNCGRRQHRKRAKPVPESYVNLSVESDRKRARKAETELNNVPMEAQGE